MLGPDASVARNLVPDGVAGDGSFHILLWSNWLKLDIHLVCDLRKRLFDWPGVIQRRDERQRHGDCRLGRNIGSDGTRRFQKMMVRQNPIGISHGVVYKRSEADNHFGA